jgi:type I restriction-modification system DNA methylase subunit
MDASQYKDYVLVMLFIKYISDRYAGQPFAPIKIPAGSTFKDMVALKNTPNIGDDINKKIIGPIAEANKLSDMPDFDHPDKLGSGADKVKKLSNLIAIFENPALNFGGNRAEGDDILGDAYEFLMRHFATESGKSKGQFYTPAEVSRVMAKIIGINNKNSTSETSVYDPTCGSGSLLLKVADEAEKMISVFGQENDTTTAGLARMNMILHNNPTAVIKQGNTLSNPLFLDDGGRVKTFDFVIANPPVKPDTSTEQRQILLQEWYREQLKALVPHYIAKWEKIMGVEVSAFGIKKMRTKWGTCNIESKRIWINLELAKKPPECLEYIVVHEMVHLLERNHNARFIAYMNRFLPQ